MKAEQYSLPKGIYRSSNLPDPALGELWDSIILTGGGSGLLYDDLMTLLNHEHILLADEVDSIHLANVRGGMKLWRLYEALQVL